MATILFSDIIGTLICEYPSMQRYPSYQKEYDIVCRIINNYLKAGNYMALVTMCDGHSTYVTMLNKVLFNIQKRIDDEVKDRLLFFTMGDYNRQLREKDKIEAKEKDGLIHLINKDGIETIYIDGKTDAIDIALKSIGNKNLFINGIGDMSSDLDMLIRIIELGGKSAIITHALNLTNISKFGDSVIQEYLSSTVTPVLNDISNKYRLETCDFTPFETLEWHRYEEWLAEEKKKIYNDLNNGSLDIEDLFLKSELLKVLSEYEMLYDFDSINSKHQKNYQVPNIIKYIDELSLYPTFEKYSQEVLGIHPNHGKM